MSPQPSLIWQRSYVLLSLKGVSKNLEEISVSIELEEVIGPREELRANARAQLFYSLLFAFSRFQALDDSLRSDIFLSSSRLARMLLYENALLS